MGSNNKQGQPNAAYGSGGDPRGRVQNQSAHQQERYESQQGPLANEMAMNYGRGAEANYGDYTDIMNQYRSIASGAGGSGDNGGGGGGGGGYSAFTVNPGKASYTDPFNSYGGFQEFSQTGGYSPSDIANMRARGISPIRAAYSNAEREVGRQRSLQGGYSPNAIAAQVKMAREQGQSAADATQNVEAGLAEARNRGRQFGLTGMSGIEGQRLGADVDLSKFNVGLDYQGQTYNADAQRQAQAQNIGAAERAANASSAASAASRGDQLRALSGMTSLYGTTPGMASTFGNQALNAVNAGGNFGLGLLGQDINSQQLPGQYDQTKNRITDAIDIGSRVANPWLPDERNQRQQGGGVPGDVPVSYGNEPFGPSYDDPNDPYARYGGQ
jgi:hypothetical protein